MNRKQFLTTFTGCCGAVAALGGAAPAQERPKPQGTPCEKKYAFSQTYVKRMMDLLDQQLDEPTRTRLMRTMGKVCFEGGHSKPAAKPAPDALEKMLDGIKKYGGDEMVRREGDHIIHFQYTRNPAGLKVADGWCLCPVVERGPEGLSGTFCECSVGYVQQMFQRTTEQPVKVTLVESLKRGGKGCKFKIELG